MRIVEHLLACLAEEAAEVSKNVCKSLRFGLDDVNVLEPNGPTNRERIVDELNDLVAMIELLVERRIIPKDWESEDKKTAKRAKVRKFMHYAHDNGALLCMDEKMPTAGTRKK